MHIWNYKLIIEAHGGPAGLHTQLRNKGHDISLHAVQAWARRGSIPSKWIAELVAINGWPMDSAWIVEDIF